MIELLEEEEIVADLRKGALQRLSDDVFLKSTLLLTNKRLVLLEKKFGSFTKRYIFLNDIQGLSSQRGFNLWLAIPGSLFCLIAVLWLLGALPGAYVTDISVTAAMTRREMTFGERIPGAFFPGVIGGVLLFVSLQYRIRISTTSDHLIFTLERGFGMERADRFINAVQVQADKLKSRNAKS